MSDDVNERTERPVKTKEEAVEYLGGYPITVRTLERLVTQRQIEFVKIGRATVFPVAGLDDYIAKHTVKTDPNPWGLTDRSLNRLRSDRAPRRSGGKALAS